MRPQDVNIKLDLESLNYEMLKDDNHTFQPRPSNDNPLYNNYYAMSCPMVFRYPYYTIDLLLKFMDGNVEYDETTSLVGVGHLLPRFVREGIDQERIVNFEALNLNETYINWCHIPRNYICIKVEYDNKEISCSKEELESLSTKCAAMAALALSMTG